jgi:hypothetical protein
LMTAFPFCFPFLFLRLPFALAPRFIPNQPGHQ